MADVGATRSSRHGEPVRADGSAAAAKTAAVHIRRLSARQLILPTRVRATAYDRQILISQFPSKTRIQRPAHHAGRVLILVVHEGEHVPKFVTDDLSHVTEHLSISTSFTRNIETIGARES